MSTLRIFILFTGHCTKAVNDLKDALFEVRQGSTFQKNGSLSVEYGLHDI